jgi:hypothetical protein
MELGTGKILGALPLNIPGPFAKFVDSPYYSESEPCGGEMMVSFSKDLPWQEMHFLQRSAHFSKTRCRQLITSKFLASKLPFHGWKSPTDRLNPIRTSAIQFESRPMRILGFSNHEKGAPR